MIVLNSDEFLEMPPEVIDETVGVEISSPNVQRLPGQVIEVDRLADLSLHGEKKINVQLNELQRHSDCVLAERSPVLCTPEGVHVGESSVAALVGQRTSSHGSEDEEVSLADLVHDATGFLVAREHLHRFVADAQAIQALPALGDDHDATDDVPHDETDLSTELVNQFDTGSGVDDVVEQRDIDRMVRGSSQLIGVSSQLHFEIRMTEARAQPLQIHLIDVAGPRDVQHQRRRHVNGVLGDDRTCLTLSEQGHAGLHLTERDRHEIVVTEAKSLMKTIPVGSEIKPEIMTEGGMDPTTQKRPQILREDVDRFRAHFLLRSMASPGLANDLSQFTIRFTYCQLS